MLYAEALTDTRNKIDFRLKGGRLMNNEIIGEKLKIIYKDVNAPDGFSLRVMLKVKAEAVRTMPSSASLHLLRRLRPALAIAACFVLLVGLYLTDVISPGVPSIEERETVQVPFEGEIPYINGDSPVVKAETAEKPEVIPAPVIPVTPSADLALVQNGQADGLPDTAVAQETPALIPLPPLQDSPVAVRLVTASQDNGGAVSEPSLLPQPLAEKVTPFIVDEADIPDSSVFMPRRRVIDSVSVNIGVGTINKAKAILEQRERFFGISADFEVAEISSDGAIVAMRSYLVPNSQVNSFVTHVSSVGSAVEVKRDRVDITQDYQRILDLHRQSIINMTATGQGAAEVNQLVADLMFFNERSREGVQNVVVWLIDGVDF